MQKKYLGWMALCVSIISVAVIFHDDAPTPAPARIDTSMLLPGMNCKATVVSPETSTADTCRTYNGIVAQVTQDEVILDEAVYQEIEATSDSETQRNVGTVRIPIAEIAAVQFWGLPVADAGDGIERIGVQFR
ncbi:MAG TPA: hypothetical protein VGH74_01420 [Planctomycetaceae bacterium]|jgi:hypothetical protein